MAQQVASLGAVSPAPYSMSAAASASSSSGFAFPPMHSFAPFFTLQRNEQTRTSQLAAWTRLVLDYCQAHRVFALDVDGAWERTTGAGGLFRNDKLQRSLEAEAQRVVLGALVDQGAAAWDPPVAVARGALRVGGGSKAGAANKPLGNRVLVYWRRPEEWAEQIYAWISNTGQNGSIMTFFELTEGDLVQDQDFRGLPIPLLRLALTTLEKQGRARVFDATEGGGSGGDAGSTGVKFT